MATPVCRLKLCDGASEHVYQLVAGLLMLARAGEISLAVELGTDGPSPHLAILEADGRRLTYDMLDGYNLEPSALAAALQGSDAYFKRSFDPGRHAALASATAMRPYGFNYGVTVRDPVFRRLAWRTRPRSARAIATWALRPELLRREQFEAPPDPGSGDTPVLFVTRVWDPAEAASGPEAEEREEMNELRAACIRGLRHELGPRALAGLAPTPYTLDRYADCVLESWLPRRAQIEQVKRADIGIATCGLHRSNGWSLGEYLAAARGIVVERPVYSVPGSFATGVNYLEFRSADECVEQTARLLGDDSLLAEMRAANHAYYHSHLRPDSLVRNTLRAALDGHV